MFLIMTLRILSTRRNLSSCGSRSFKVAVLGGAGGVGQALNLLLKSSPYVSQLSIYDIVHSIGVAADLSHIDTTIPVKGFIGPVFLPCALEGADIVVITAGYKTIPGKKDRFREELFKPNAPVIKKLIESCAKTCPKALIAIITNPVNSLVPLAAEVLKKHRVFDPKRLFGVTSVDVLRSCTMVGKLMGVDPQDVSVPCIGGHSVSTIVPLLSNCNPKFHFSDDQVVCLTTQIKNAGSEILKAKKYASTSTLGTGVSTFRFITSLCRGLSGERGVVECTYVSSNITEATFFSSPVLLGRSGVEEIYPLPCMTKYEKELMDVAVSEVKKNVEEGIMFMNQ